MGKFETRTFEIGRILDFLTAVEVHILLVYDIIAGQLWVKKHIELESVMNQSKVFDAEEDLKSIYTVHTDF